MIRNAEPSDIEALIRVENRSFLSDRFSTRTFRYLLSKAHATTLVDVEDDNGGKVRAYATLLFSRGTSLARLYSIAVDPEHQGRGIGWSLLRAAEQAALERDAVYMRLEVRADDPVTQAFYARAGFRKFGVQTHYYDDDADAVRMEKCLVRRPHPELARVPFYAQSLDFTCGPAAMLMAMHALDSEMKMNQTAELRLWRESTTVFMMSGHGGCSPEGLAVAAARRGFAVKVFLSGSGVLFIDSVRSEAKKDVIRLVQEDFRGQLQERGIPVMFQPLSVEAMRAEFDAGRIPVVLISSYRFDRQKQPHYVVVTGFDSKYVYLNDPSVDTDSEKTLTDCIQIPVLLRDFAQMARYGRSQQKAALVIGKAGS